MHATSLGFRSNPRLAMGVALLGAIACGEGEGPLATSTFRDYDGQFTYELNPLLSLTSDTIVVHCEGTVSIAEPALGDVRGTFMVQTRTAGCLGSGDVVGSVEPEGGVVLALSAAEQPEDEVFPAFGCRAVEGFRDFAGTITDRQLALETNFVAVCPTGGASVRFQWLVSFIGER